MVNRPHIPAGTALLVNDAAAVFGGVATGQRKIAPTIFTNPHSLFPFHTLPNTVINQIINSLWIEDLRKRMRINQLEFERQRLELECVEGVGTLPAVICSHPVWNRFFDIIPVQQHILKEPDNLFLYCINVAGDMRQVFSGQQIKKCSTVHFFCSF